MYRELGHKNGVSDSLICIGLVYQNLKKYHLALEYFRKALAMAEEIGDKRGICYALGSIGSVYENLEDYHIALDIMRQIIGKEPLEISVIRPGIPGLLNRQVMTMLAKDPRQRSSADSIRDTLKILEV